MDSYEDQSLLSSMHAFEAALAAKVEIPRPRLERLLVAPDGSDQDATARGLGDALAARTGAVPVEKSEIGDARAILQAAVDAGAGLVVVPSPFHESYFATGGESLGSAVDVVLAEARMPVLAVRAPQEDPAACFRQVVVPVSICDARTPGLIGWALAVASPGARVLLLDVPDLSVLEEARKLLGDAIDLAALRKEALEKAAARDSSHLLEAARKAAAEHGIEVSEQVEVGHPLEVFARVTEGGAWLVVTSLPGPAGTPEYHRAHDLALRSKGPVLFV